MKENPGSVASRAPTSTSRKHVGTRPKKSLGQNFLIDPNTARKIVACLQVQPNQKIFEIGPGSGALSSILCEQGADLFVLEKDRDLALKLKTSRIIPQIIVGDALLFDWSRLNRCSSWKIIGNLPYNIASPVIWNVVRTASNCSRMIFLIQKEVAQRICSKPGGRTYGALSVWVQSFTRVKLEFPVGPRVFYPRPKVDSALISLQPHADHQIPFQGHQLEQLLDICFQKRRKQISTILKPYWTAALTRWFQEQGLSSSCRPENLTPRQFQEISSHLFS